jgi:hypothetical protein
VEHEAWLWAGMRWAGPSFVGVADDRGSMQNQTLAISQLVFAILNRQMRKNSFVFRTAVNLGQKL